MSSKKQRNDWGGEKLQDIKEDMIKFLNQGNLVGDDLWDNKDFKNLCE
jgi:hypothetical protein